ncbi:outer membrane protein [Vibrio variabilis]|uniref:outer membrane protein n=1 Tax=Vibrio variabilis TaxID=990271 RepID=UPI000DD52984|nr:outer membrane beta-barrel protein [Vibrio variabilis]
MKKIHVVVAPIIFGVCGVASASGVYIGADLALGNKTALETQGASFDETNEVGLGALAGYNFTITPMFDLGVEAEYRTIGEADFNIDDNKFQSSGSFYGVNLRPKYTLSTGAFAAAVIGVGQMEMKLSHNSTSETNSGTAYQLGVEGGYAFDSGVDLVIGYRFTEASDIEGIEFGVSGIYGGARYNF